MTRLSTLLLRGAAAAALLLTAPALRAQQVAFPGAEGAGKFTTGGRGKATAPTTVFEVTSLSDAAGAATTPGTLRYALTQTAAARTIVFRVCGTIHLTSRLSLNKANTTLAGQTAPGQGICLADYPVSISANNLIIRFLRFRLGDRFQKLVDASGNPINGSGDGDALSGTGYKNIVVDHCTMSWSDDEAFTVYSGDSTTLQWNLISEPLNYSYHFETGDTDYERHGYGGIWGGQHASFHHNLFAHCLSRTPRFNGSRYVNQVNWENCDFRNNVLYNWGSNNVYGGEGANYNVVNNYYKYGPSTSSSARFRILNPYKQTSAPVLPYGKYYFTGNYVDGSASVTNRNWLGALMNGGTAADTALARVTTPFPLIPIPTQTAQEAYAAVLQNVGCVLPQRDTLDQRIINNVINRTGRIIDVQGGYAHGTPYSTSQSAWPVLTCGTAPADNDHDGMPDAWEVQNGLNPNDAADRQAIGAGGYTNLENYLNGIAAVVMGTKDGQKTAVALQAYPNPATEQLTLQHPLASRAARVTVYGFNGQVVASYAAASGRTETRLPLAGLPAGNYLVRFADEQLSLTTKIVKR
ncbi:T9SS type A sorting domain-containing protein [Hymenobacter sp. 15J16-1T3B]|uniref:T9SS type A sorting domain-containing protein n=1 Tax=Hymenobacter sp. 15J16-1T3B TaxID=2886941 RepID=UPI001D0FDC25|nr:T9SS type A sorting domain-containing protein [Hymenobacter sp. 15J16-1T3B]MCC3156595.1 T9SS type A sorting domain-containing protein [Hymenobacter sp. 15J16-1T3B]